MFIWNPSSVTSCFFAYLQESHPKTLLSHLGRIAAWTRMTKRDGRCEWGGVVCVGRRKWKTRKKGEWWQYLLHQFECLSSQVTHRSMWSANRRENIHFGEERKEEEWEWVREDGARVYLCCVSCHLCVRAHHTNCEACAHTSSITLLSAGHQHSHIDRVSEKTLFLRLARHRSRSTTCMSISEPTACSLVYWGFLLVEESVSLGRQICEYLSEGLEPKCTVYHVLYSDSTVSALELPLRVWHHLCLATYPENKTHLSTRARPEIGKFCFHFFFFFR